MIKKNIDKGESFEWGKTSLDYGRYRDIYPETLYQKLKELRIGEKGQKILDLGTGTGVFPRAMYLDNIEFVGTDLSKNQIEMAKKLSKKESKKINFHVVDSANIEFKPNTFDIVTSVQSWHYFDEEILLPKIRSILKPSGKLVIVFMHWLPNEDNLVNASESLILKYNPNWTGGGIERIKLKPRNFAGKEFKANNLLTFDAQIPFSRDSWLGRIRASRGIGATLSKELIEKFDKEHKELIANLRPDNFTIIHQLTVEIYKQIEGK